MSRAGGFTLVEMVVTIVILAIALAGVAGMVALGTSNSANTLLETRAIALGQAYLDEIMGRRFDERSDPGGLDPCYGFSGPDRCSAVGDLGPDGGEGSRDRYDDVDDYNGLQEGDGLPDPISDAEGDPRSGYDNFLVEVAVGYAGDDFGPAIPDADTPTLAKLITVTVIHRTQNQGWEFSVYKGNF